MAARHHSARRSQASDGDSAARGKKRKTPRVCPLQPAPKRSIAHEIVNKSPD